MPIKEKPIKRQDGEEQNNGQRMNGGSIKGNFNTQNALKLRWIALEVTQ